MAAGQMAVLGKVLEAQVTRHLRPCVGAFDCCRRDIHGGLVASKPAPESTAPKLGPVGTASFDDFGFGSFLAADQATCSADPLNLEDTERLYSALSTGELAKGVFNLSLVGSSLLVDASSKLLMSDLMKNKLFAAPVNWVVRRTAYSHFCAGGTIEEAKATLLRTSELGLRSILDYSVEDAMDSATCDKNLAGNLETLRHVASLPRHCSSHSVVKITSFVPLPVLERASALLRWQHQHPSVDLPWKRPSFPMLAPGSILPAQAEPAPLSPEEVQSLEACLERLRAVCRACHGLHLPLLIDAEYFSVQPAIDYLAGVAALEFNREFPLVVNTFQCYLKDALPRLQLAIQAARRADVSFAAKLVRGAYIVKETQRAAEGSYENPIQAGIDSTHANYDRCATLMLETAARGARRNAVVLASHNVASVRRAIGTADALGLARKDERLQFAQLKGMADALSLAIGHAGYLCSKLHPFGSVEETLPYLIRRAQENKGMLMQAGTDRARLQHELLRRIRSSLGLA